MFVDRILSTRMITPIKNVAVEKKAYLPEKQKRFGAQISFLENGRNLRT
jgi:hypothetical protein